MTSGYTPEEARDLAALYALGALGDDELRQFEAVLVEDPVLTKEVAAFSSVVSDLSYAVTPQAPPPELREKLLGRIGAEGLTKEHPKLTKENQDFASATWLEWIPLFPGVELKILHVDEARGYATTLVKMSPGATIPLHRHVEPEDSYVLEGEITVSGVLMRPGDHCHARSGTIHLPSTTTTGCTYIAVKSLRDEWLMTE